MDCFIQTIDKAIQKHDYSTLATVFSFGPLSWETLGQGEQRQIASHFIESAIESNNFVQAALSNSEMMTVFLDALKHLPTTPVEGGSDNTLRQKIFEYNINEEGNFLAAALVLAGMRMEDNKDSVYYFTPAEKCDVYVRISECYLNEDQIAESDSAVTKAGMVVPLIENPEAHQTLILRYKSTYARVLDNNRKFLQAASRYHDLSQSPGDLVRAEDLLTMLGKAVTCAVLAPSGPQRQRVLKHLYKDPRLNELKSIPDFETHATILTKMFKSQILGKDELVKFESSLQPHQKAVMGDGLTIMERGVIEANMLAISRIYKSIYLNELASKLGVSDEKAEKIVGTMIIEGSLDGSIDQISNLVEFDSDCTPNRAWDKGVSSFCMELNRITEIVEKMY